MIDCLVPCCLGDQQAKIRYMTHCPLPRRKNLFSLPPRENFPRKLQKESSDSTCKFSSILPRSKRLSGTEGHEYVPQQRRAMHDASAQQSSGAAGLQPPLLTLGQRNGAEKAAPCTRQAPGLLLQSPGSRKGDTQSLTTYILLPSDSDGSSLQLSITPCKHRHKDTVIFDVHLKASSGGALRAAKQTPLENAQTIIIRLIYSIRLWKAITRVN